jgi:hypothetical protein
MPIVSFELDMIFDGNEAVDLQFTGCTHHAVNGMYNYRSFL